MPFHLNVKKKTHNIFSDDKKVLKYWIFLKTKNNVKKIQVVKLDVKAHVNASTAKWNGREDFLYFPFCALVNHTIKAGGNPSRGRGEREREKKNQASETY